MVEVALISIVGIVIATLFAVAVARLYSTRVKKGDDVSVYNPASGSPASVLSLDLLLEHDLRAVKQAKRRTSQDMYEKLFSIEDLDSDVRESRAEDPSAEAFEIPPLTPFEYVADIADEYPAFQSVTLEQESSCESSIGTDASSERSSKASYCSNSSVVHITTKPDKTGCLGVILTKGGSVGADDKHRNDDSIDDDAVSVKRLLPGGVGWLSQSLEIGDELLSVDGYSVQGYSVQEVVKYITSVNADCIANHRDLKLVVRRTNSSAGI